jgi:uncharacterized membrane protein YphA (DoxX/SURF4 family)
MVVGRRVYGLGAILAGGVSLAFGAASAPDQAHRILALAGGVLLVLAGVGVNLGRRIAACAAVALAIYFVAAWTVLRAAALPHDWKTWVTWQDLAESVAMSMGGVIAWRLLGGDDARRVLAAKIARLAFGACLLVFGTSHFVYLKYTAAVVPAWIPPSQVFWACATGAAHIAAGLAILSGVQARLAAMLLTAMFVIFGLLVHLPSVIREPHNHMNWSENAVNLVLVGAAWCVADLLGRRA